MYTISNGILVGAGIKNVQTPKRSSGRMTPKFLVVHYTAGENYESDVKTLSTAPAQVSAHLVIGPKGEVVQIGNFTDKLWHAGKSSWKGYNGLNSHSIGIEVTCPGPLDSDGDKYKTWYGKVIKDGAPWPVVWASHKNDPNNNHRPWAKFTEAQIKALIDVGTVLMNHYNLEEAVGHDDISPGRKQDPGPSCPVNVFSILNGRRVEQETVERPDLPSTRMKYKVVGVAPESLNFRVAPNGDKRGELFENAIVEFISQDHSKDWYQVRTPAGYVGWVYSKYLRRV